MSSRSGGSATSSRRGTRARSRRRRWSAGVWPNPARARRGASTLLMPTTTTLAASLSDRAHPHARAPCPCVVRVCVRARVCARALRQIGGMVNAVVPTRDPSSTEECLAATCGLLTKYGILVNVEPPHTYGMGQCVIRICAQVRGLGAAGRRAAGAAGTRLLPPLLRRMRLLRRKPLLQARPLPSSMSLLLRRPCRCHCTRQGSAARARGRSTWSSPTSWVSARRSSASSTGTMRGVVREEAAAAVRRLWVARRRRRSGL